MPSGPKKRRAAKRKNEAKQNEEFTKVSVVKMTIPIEELAKGAVWHEATSVDKEMDKAKNIIVEVPNEFKAQAKETDVSTKFEGVDLNEVKSTIDEVSDYSNDVQENNELPLLDVTSNEDILVSSDDLVLSTNTCCIMENVESSGISQENESAGQLTSAPEQMLELFSDDMTADEILERYHHLFFDNDITTLEYDKDGGFFFRDIPVVVPGVVTDFKVLEANEVDTVGKCDIGGVQDKEISKDVMIVSQNFRCIVESVELGESVVVPEMTVDTAPLVSVNVMSNESIKEEENNVMIYDQATEANDAAQLVSDIDTVLIFQSVELPVVLSPPSSNELLKENAASAENIGLSDSNGTGTVSPVTEDKVTEIPFNPKELLNVPQVKVPRATENRVYLACPTHCNAECSFSQLLRDELLENVEELKIAIRSLKEDLEKALDKLHSISY